MIYLTSLVSQVFILYILTTTNCALWNKEQWYFMFCQCHHASLSSLLENHDIDCQGNLQNHYSN